MSPELAFTGLGALSVVALSLMSARRQYNVGVDNMTCAAILAASWVYVFFGEKWFPAPPPPPYLPPPFLPSVSVVDALSAIGIGLLAYTRPAKWKVALFWLLIMELCAEVAFWAWATAHNETPRGLLYYRALVCNLLYCCQLFCVGWAGASHAFLGRIVGERRSAPSRRDRWSSPVGAP